MDWELDWENVQGRSNTQKSKRSVRQTPDEVALVKQSLPPSKIATQRQRDGQKRRRNAIIVFGVSLAHFGVILLCLGASGKGAISDSPDLESDGAMEVSLVRQVPSGGASATASEPVADLVARLTPIPASSPLSPDTAPKAPRPAADLDALMGTRSGRGGQGDHNSAGASAGEGATPPKQKQSRAGGPEGGQLSAGALWGQIEPCWRQSQGQVHVPVALEITLNASGRLALPPKILRPTNAAADEARLFAEAKAISAVAACGPYTSPGLVVGGGVFRVEFPSKQK